jgi:hypothetical protein
MHRGSIPHPSALPVATVCNPAHAIEWAGHERLTSGPRRLRFPVQQILDWNPKTGAG